jgi:hypothetical protein
VAADRPPVPTSVSEQAQRYLGAPFAVLRPEPPALDDVDAWKERIAATDAYLVERFGGVELPVRSEDVEIAGVRTFVLRGPEVGDDPATPVYLDIHGGALISGAGEACRLMGFHRSTYYALKHKVDRWGLEALRVRERRRPRMPNQIGPHLEQRIIAFALARPGCGPRRISAELRRPKWGGIRISEHGVWRVLRRFNLNTRSKRLALVARHAEPYELRPPVAPLQRHIEATEPGEKVQLDCFYVGRLRGTNGAIWQITAIDIFSSYAWAELVVCPNNNPTAAQTSTLARRVAPELKAAGWRLERMLTDG